MEVVVLVVLLGTVAAFVGVAILGAREQRRGTLPMWIPVTVLGLALVMIAGAVVTRSFLTIVAGSLLAASMGLQIIAVRRDRRGPRRLR